MFSVVFQAHDGPTSQAAIVKISREPAVQGRGSCRASLAGIVYDIVSAAFVPVGCEGWRGGKAHMGLSAIVMAALVTACSCFIPNGRCLF